MWVFGWAKSVQAPIQQWNYFIAQKTDPSCQHSNAYNIFIPVLTVFSLVVMVVLLLPLDDSTVELL
jgi:hypothetical protein